MKLNTERGRTDHFEFDGTSVLYRDDQFWGRYEVKKGKTPPSDFVPATEVDPETGKQQGWRPITDDPEWKWHRTAIDVGHAYGSEPFKDGQTYELVGPKINGNPDRFEGHVLVRHGYTTFENAPRDYEGIRAFLDGSGYEGIVWHHPDGRMVKIKQKDFPRAEKVASAP